MKKLLYVLIAIIIIIALFNHYNNKPPMYRSITLSYFDYSYTGYGQRLHVAIVEKPSLVQFSFVGPDLVLYAQAQNGTMIKSDFRLVNKAIIYLQKGLVTKKYIISKINHEYYLNYKKYPSSVALAFDFTDLYKHKFHR